MRGYKVVVVWLDSENNKICDSVMVRRYSLDQLTENVEEHLREMDLIIEEGDYDIEPINTDTED